MSNIHTNINIYFGTDENKTKKFMDILSPEGYTISLERDFEYFDNSDTVKMIILCMTSFDTIAKIRAKTNVPIMYIAEKADEFSVIMGLSKGADTVVSEDISGMEFAARVKAILRRSSSLRNAKIVSEHSFNETKPICKSASISVDDISREVCVKGTFIQVTNLEFGILKYLMENSGKICSTEQIYKAVWGANSFDVKKTVVEHIRRLRQKIETDPKNPAYIKVVFGLGYIFNDYEIGETAAKSRYTA